VTSNEVWRTLTTDYQQSLAREDSLDRLMEWDAEREVIGSIAGKEMLDVGCDSGGKAIELAQRDGAASVVGLDIGSEFLTPPPDLDVTLVTSDPSELDTVSALQPVRHNPLPADPCLCQGSVKTLRAARSFLPDDGAPHQVRRRAGERDDVGLGDAYHSAGQHS
jgi:hypothetical protein